MELGTRAAFAWRAGAYGESEEEQVEALLPWLSPGMLVLADRGYCGFPLWRRASDAGADLLWRMKSNLRLPVLESANQRDETKDGKSDWRFEDRRT